MLIVEEYEMKDLKRRVCLSIAICLAAGCAFAASAAEVRESKAVLTVPEGKTVSVTVPGVNLENAEITVSGTAEIKVEVEGTDAVMQRVETERERVYAPGTGEYLLGTGEEWLTMEGDYHYKTEDPAEAAVFNVTRTGDGYVLFADGYYLSNFVGRSLMKIEAAPSEQEEMTPSGYWFSKDGFSFSPVYYTRIQRLCRLYIPAQDGSYTEICEKATSADKIYLYTAGGGSDLTLATDPWVWTYEAEFGFSSGAAYISYSDYDFRVKGAAMSGTENNVFAYTCGYRDEIVSPASSEIRFQGIGEGEAVVSVGELVYEVRVEALPDAPASLNASNRAAGVSLSWTATENAEKYEVLRCGEVIGETAGTSYTDGSAESGAMYTYAVRSVKGGYTSETGTETKIMFLSMPSGVKANNEEGGIRVSWEAVKGASSYTVYRRAEGASAWKAQYTTSSASTVSYLNKTVKDSEGVFYYTVRANCVSADGTKYTSSKAATGTKVTRTLTVTLDTPVIKSITNGVSSILVKWTRVQNADGYRVYRRGGNETEWTLMKYVKQPSGGSTVSFGNTTPQNGEFYVYKVTAYKNAYGKEWTGEESHEKGYLRLTAPVLNAESRSGGRIAFSWTKNEAAFGYQVEYTAEDSFSGATRKTLNGTDKLSAVYKGFTPGGTYHVRVRAFWKYRDEESGQERYCYGTWSGADESGQSVKTVVAE